jgi:hypothetical protein
MARERSFGDVPRAITIVAIFAVIVQVLTSASFGPIDRGVVRQLPAVIPLSVARTVALGEPVWFSRVLSIWLQTFDHQSGISVSWQALDYQRLIGWLDLQLLLDPDNPFPTLAASRLYGAVADRRKIRLMLDYVVLAFNRDPARHWRWMASAVVTARHRLGDLHLAEKLASDLDTHTKGVAIASWARQMHIFLKADMGKRALAIELLTALIESGEITRRQEVNFLHYRLGKLQKNVK